MMRPHSDSGVEPHQSALAQVRRMIDGGVFASGGRLPPERVLAEELGVGRRSLRRALDVLEGEGRIWRRQGQGTFVTSARRPAPTPLAHAGEQTNPMEVMEIRLTIEPAMARLAALRASRCDLERLARLARETRSARNAAAYERANAAFHRRIAEAARNTLFLAMFDAVSEVSRDPSAEGLGENGRCFKRQAVYADVHAEIVAAITARDAARAEAVMYDHLLDVQQQMLARAWPAAVVEELRV